MDLGAPFKLYGAAADYFDCEEREVLNESGARTGKTHSELVKAYYVAETYPGSRQLFARETRKSLSETVLPDWENKILGRHHPAVGRRHRDARSVYNFPNGSTIVLHGLDDPENVLSGEFDRIYVFQAEQLRTDDAWNALLSRMSGSATPYCQATADANPGSDRHWLIKRIEETLCLFGGHIVQPPDAKVCQECGGTALGRMAHFAFRHHDNPLLFNHATGTWWPFGEQYLGTLGRTRGLRRKRLFLHQWVSEEGQVLEDYDPAIHRIAGQLTQDADGWLLKVNAPGWEVGAKDAKGNPDHWREANVRLEWFGAGADWGFSPNPATMQVWGYDRYGRRFLVAQVYKTKQQMEWWAQTAVTLYQEFKMRYIACDPSANALIELFNQRLSGLGGREGPAIAIGADNTIRRQKPDLAGIDLMRWGLRDPDGLVRTYLLKDTLRYGIDPELREASRPVCLEDEIPDWVFGKVKSTEEPLEKPDEDCDDHGLDAWRYEAGEGWGVRHAATIGAPKYPEGSAGEVHHHEEKMAKAKAWRERHG